MQIDWRRTVYSDGSREYVSPLEPSLGGRVTLSLRAHRRSPIDRCWLVTIPEGERIHTPMEPAGEDGFFRYWRATTEVVQDLLHYRFLLLTPGSLYWYSQGGLTAHTPGDHLDFHLRVSQQDVPWLHDRVFYQIFPDRFRNGDGALNVREGEYAYQGKTPIVRPWGENPLNFEKGGHLDFFGGDLAGIEHSLDYLEELGVNALYLNPVFEAPSNHKYDVQDYHRIDPHFGTNADFARLCDRARRRDMRVILDGVFNHVGVAHRWFNRCGFYDEPGAWGFPDSPYREFFTFYGDDDYHCWLGVRTLPKLDFRSPRVRDAVYRRPDSAVRFWMAPPYSIDGWRIDVANMQARQGAYQGHREVWREFRRSFKEENPAGYLMGEHFFDPVELLQGDMLDGAMNYQGFLFPVLRFFQEPGMARIGTENVRLTRTPGAEVLDGALAEVRARIGWRTQHQMYNLLGSHDLPRAWSLLGHDEGAYFQALTLLFTYPGVPSLLYGDEIGLEGLTEAETRSCMEWDPRRWNGKIRAFVQRLIALRRRMPALQQGGFLTLAARGGLYAFVRIAGAENVVTVLNRGQKPLAVRLPLWRAGLLCEEGEDLLTGERFSVKEGVLETTLGPRACHVLHFTRRGALRDG